MLERAWGVEAVQLESEGRQVLLAGRAPVVQPGLQRHAVGQPVRDTEPAAALQLRQHDDDLKQHYYLPLPCTSGARFVSYHAMEGRHRVHCAELAAGGHHVVTLLAVAANLHNSPVPALQ